MSEMTEERLNEIERVIRQKDYSGSLRLKMAYHDITELVAEVRRLREAAKGQAIVAEQAGARIRELEKVSDQLMKRKMELFDEKIELLFENHKMHETLEWIRDEGSDHWSIRKARNILDELEVVTDD